jgi:hypothetical protein
VSGEWRVKKGVLLATAGSPLGTDYELPGQFFFPLTPRDRRMNSRWSLR